MMYLLIQTKLSVRKTFVITINIIIITIIIISIVQVTGLSVKSVGSLICVSELWGEKKPSCLQRFGSHRKLNDSQIQRSFRESV